MPKLLGDDQGDIRSDNPTLFALYAHYFSAPGADASGPPAAQLKAALARIGFDAVRFNRDRIAFIRPGMATSLNGVAQGFITDRVFDLCAMPVSPAASSTWARLARSALRRTAARGASGLHR
ncbi:FAD:protein FMN transferase [Rhizobium sullae]|uniref:FAD:protein FMN transferase n=1 Tax=Rhizobium sullae TaxID=50338 RepID=UPI001179CE3E